MPKNQQRSNQVDAKQVEFPQMKQDKKAKIEVNWFLAVADVNLQQYVQGLQFENIDKILQLQAPEVNNNQNPEFLSIKKGLRKLDVNPNEAVIYFQKSETSQVKVTKNFEKFLRNDNNIWTLNQNKQHLQLLKEKYEQEIQNYKTKYANSTANVLLSLDEIRYQAAFRKLEDIVKTKFTNGDYEAAGVHTKTLSELKASKQQYDSLNPVARQNLVKQIEQTIVAIESMHI